MIDISCAQRHFPWRRDAISICDFCRLPSRAFMIVISPQSGNAVWKMDGWKSSTIGQQHGLRTPGEEIVFTARPKINSHSQIFRWAEAYFVCHIGPNFHISLIYAFIGCPHIRNPWFESILGRNNYCHSSFCTANLFKAIVTFSIMGSNQKVT